MRDYAFRIVNVFAESPLAGNPLAVFEDARGMDDATMQALALQFNLSETTFVLPSERATARVRIFTPTFEMPFAGHPTLGTAHVVRAAGRAGDDVTLEMRVGIIPVHARGDVWTLQANAPTASRRGRDARRSRGDAGAGARRRRTRRGGAAAVGRHRIGAARDPARLRGRRSARGAARRSAARARPHGAARDGVRLRARAATAAPGGTRAAVARFFFPKHGAVVEDPGTGSACANLGGWLLATGAALPQRIAIAQGDAVGRPCRLGLEVGADRQIRVSGRVIELARGVVRL